MLIMDLAVHTHISNVIDKDYYRKTKPSFSTVEECIDEEISHYEYVFGDDYDLSHFDCLKVLFKDEFDNQTALFFQSTDSTVWLYVIEKSVNNDETEYKLIHSETVFLYHEDWQEYGNFKFSCSEKIPDKSIDTKSVASVTVDDKIYYITVVHN